MLNQLRYAGNLFIFTLGLSALAVLAAPTERLQNYNTRIEQARSEGATVLAPMSLRLAETELLRAHKTVRNRADRPFSVEHALEMVDYRIEELRQVLEALKSAGFDMTEETAIRRVRESHPHMSPKLSKNEAMD